ncbi:hypothetical protein [Kribbella sp. NPDC055071]
MAVQGSSGRVWRRRLAALALVGVLLWASSAGTAAAHGGLPHFASAITSVEPAVPGMHISVATDGRYLRITNPTRRTVIVLGYDQDQYLRITAHGVARNVHSPTSYRNEGHAVPADANANAAPEWEEISTSSTAQFPDDRIRWTGPGRPAVVDQAPNKLHLIRTWAIELLVDGTLVTINGTLSWHPGSSPTSLVAFAAVCVALLVGVVVLLLRDERRNRTRQLSRPT